MLFCSEHRRATTPGRMDREIWRRIKSTSATFVCVLVSRSPAFICRMRWRKQFFFREFKLKFGESDSGHYITLPLERSCRKPRDFLVRLRRKFHFQFCCTVGWLCANNNLCKQLKIDRLHCACRSFKCWRSFCYGIQSCSRRRNLQ
jgi:hypothetical protein